MVTLSNIPGAPEIDPRNQSGPKFASDKKMPPAQIPSYLPFKVMLYIETQGNHVGSKVTLYIGSQGNHAECAEGPRYLSRLQWHLSRNRFQRDPKTTLFFDCSTPQR